VVASLSMVELVTGSLQFGKWKKEKFGTEKGEDDKRNVGLGEQSLWGDDGVVPYSGDGRQLRYRCGLFVDNRITILEYIKNQTR
jgi:hypothetical protein